MLRISASCLRRNAPHGRQNFPPSITAVMATAKNGRTQQQHSYLVENDWIVWKTSAPDTRTPKPRQGFLYEQSQDISTLHFTLGSFEFGKLSTVLTQQKRGSQGGPVATGSSALRKGPTTKVVVRPKRRIPMGSRVAFQREPHERVLR